MRASALVLIASATALLASTAAMASSHREAPSIAEDPYADNTDVYAWVTPGTRDNVYLIANFNPLEAPSGGPNFHGFSDNVRYNIKISRGDSLDPVVIYRFRFETSDPAYVDPADQDGPLIGGHQFFLQLSGKAQTMTVRKKVPGSGVTTLGNDLPVAPANIGPRTNVVAYGLTNPDDYNDQYVADNFVHTLSGGEGRVFAGPRDDGFYVDLAGTFDLANFGGPDVNGPRDGVAGHNCHTIALEVPSELLTSDGAAPPAGGSTANTLGVWATAERRKVTIRKNNGKVKHFGKWRQVSRLGIPLLNEVVIGLQDKDRYNAGEPKNDAANFAGYYLNPVIVRDGEAVGTYTDFISPAGADPNDYKYGRTDILDVISLEGIIDPNDDRQITAVGDVLRLDLGLDSQFPNGRAIPGGDQDQEQVDVTDVEATLLLVGLTDGFSIADGVNRNDKDFLNEFPFLPLPHRGFDEGQGQPAP